MQTAVERGDPKRSVFFFVEAAQFHQRRPNLPGVARPASHRRFSPITAPSFSARLEIFVQVMQ